VTPNTPNKMKPWTLVPGIAFKYIDMTM